MLEHIDDHIITKNYLLLRPGASRRISFRGTPGGQVTIRVSAMRGPDLGDTEVPVNDGPRFVRIEKPMRRSNSCKPIVDPSRSAAEQAQIRSHLLEALLTTPGNPEGGAGVSFLDNAPFTRPISSFGAGDLVIVVPNPTDPGLLGPRPPMQVRIGVKNGPTLRVETATSQFPREAIINTVGPFSGHDIIEVTFTNPNDFPILFSTFIGVQNDLEITTTTLPFELISRVFRDTLAFFSPSFGIRDGRLYFSFAEEVQETFGIDPFTQDIDINVDASVKIDAVKFELLSHVDVIRTLVREMEAEIRAVQSSILNLPDVPADFVQRTVDAFFSKSTDLPFLFTNEMGLHELQWGPAFSRRPILKVVPQHAGERDEVALCFHLQLTELIAGNSRLELNVDTISATLYMVLRSGSDVVPHPVRSLQDDFVRGGFIFPRIHLTVDISRIDTQIDLGGGVFTPLEWLIEAGANALANYLRNDLEEAVVQAGISYLEDYQREIGELVTETMREIANRNHVFRRLRVTNQDWIIETLDPAQLAVPFVAPDPIDHRFDDVGVNVPPVQPIDGPMPATALAGLRRVNHLVFLMMENRSFDHMLGYLSHPNHLGRTDVDGLSGQPIRLGGDFAGTEATPQSRPRLSFAPDPGHGFDTVTAQINDGAMDGFVSEFARRLEASDEINPRGNLNDPERVLGFHTGDQLPTYHQLARDYVILDRWFCSFPGATYPNRVCYYSGITPVTNNSDVFNDAGYLTDLTLFDLLDRENVEWIIYESDITFLRMFDKYRLETARIRPIEEFFGRLQALPPVTFIDPNFRGVPSADQANDDHPSTDVTAGQDFIARVITQLCELPDWSTTMLVITYDEHGGFSDHVPPPGTSASDFPPAPDGSPSVPLAHPDARSFGPRVPTFVVSPLVKGLPSGRRVGHRIYDHATVYRTIVERFMRPLRNSVIIPERVRRARHLGELVDPTMVVEVQHEEFTAPSIALPAPPAAVIRSDRDNWRPHLIPPPDTEDFHYYMTRLGNPIKKGA